MLGDLGPEHLTKERCRFYAARRRAEGRKDGTIIRELGTLRAALVWAQRERWIADAPHVEKPRQPPPRDRWLTRAEATRLIDAALAPHVRLFLQLALYTAGRAGAILDLTWDRVDLRGGRVDLGRTQGGKGRAVVPIPAPLLTALWEAREGATCPYVVEHGGKRVGSVKTGARAAARRARLPGVTPHILRHTAATWMVLRGVPIEEVARYLGHSDSRITERVYGKHTPEYLSRAARALEC